VLNAMQIIPALLAGLFAGAWVDRLQRRPLLIGADIGRALVLASLPLSALLGMLHIGQVYVVALMVSILTIIFDVAYQAYLPGLIGKAELVEGNSKLSASAAVAEFGGFSIAGWLVQALTAPLAILIDAASFAISAITLGLIRSREAVVMAEEQPDMYREIGDGLQAVWQQALLRAIAVAVLVEGLADGIFRALVVLYMSRGLGFNPGILTMIWAVGGVSSFAGAALAPRLTRRFGPGRLMITGLAVFGITTLFIPLASGATLLSAVFLIIAQISDGFFTVYEITRVSLVQGLVTERLLGRVNATLRFLGLGAALLGSLLGGLLGGTLGVRPTLVMGACGTLLAALALAVSPLRSLKQP
jgi:Na+/melibiose symporter-like transporter